MIHKQLFSGPELRRNMKFLWLLFLALDKGTIWIICIAFKHSWAEKGYIASVGDLSQKCLLTYMGVFGLTFIKR